MRDLIQPKSQYEECTGLLASLQNDERKILVYRTLLVLTAIGGTIGFGFLVAWMKDYVSATDIVVNDFRNSCPTGDIKLCLTSSSPNYAYCNKELLSLMQSMVCGPEQVGSILGAVMLPIGVVGSIFAGASCFPGNQSLCDRTQALLNLTESPKTNKEAIALLSEKKLALENLHPWTLQHASVKTPLLAHPDEDQPRRSLCQKLTDSCCSFFGRRNVQPAAGDIDLDNGIENGDSREFIY